jgi:DNA-binding GntR family transcriptional regulator
LLARLVVDEPGRPRVILGELRRVILEGAVPPGTVIPLREVAELFGVGHTPVREALRNLLGAGLVEHEPDTGYFVAEVDPGELREMYLVRQTLEEAALAAAVTRATDADRDAVTEVAEQLEQALREDEPVAYHRLSRQFHLALTQPSRMFRLLHMLESAWNITEPVQSMARLGRAERMRLHTDHAMMLDAFLNRDAPRLIAIAQRHHERLEAVIGAPVLGETAHPAAAADPGSPAEAVTVGPDDISFAQ